MRCLTRFVSIIRWKRFRQRHDVDEASVTYMHLRVRICLASGRFTLTSWATFITHCLRSSMIRVRMSFAEYRHIAHKMHDRRRIMWNKHAYTLGVCGSTLTRGYTRPDPYPRVRVGVWSSRCLTGRVGSVTGTTSTGTGITSG